MAHQITIPNIEADVKDAFRFMIENAPDFWTWFWLTFILNAFDF